MRVARNAAITFALTFALVLSAFPALAFWQSQGNGSGTGSTATLLPPTEVSAPAHNGTSVPVSWTASSGALIPDGYVVTRASGGVVSAACGSSRLSPITRSSCTDTVSQDGTYIYTVTAIYRSWSAASVASASVVVAVASRLAFTVNPSNSVVNVAISPSIAVVVRSADGNPVLVSGTSVTLAIGANPASGTLSGTLTATTDPNGVAAFPGLSINTIGAGYTLIATSGSLSSATSTAFTITAPALAGPNLGRAAPFSALGSAMTLAGATTISGDLGSYPTASATGYQSIMVKGETHTGDATASGALTDAAAAYTDLASRAPTREFTGDQAGLTFLPGVNHTAAAFSLSAGGILTLDGQNDPNAVFIFQIDAALDTAANSTIKLVNGAQASNVFWQVNGAAGPGADSSFSGTILAKGASTIGAGAQLIGRVLATGAVTIANNTIRFTEALAPTISIAGGSSVTTANRTPTFSGVTSAAAGRGIVLTFGTQSLTTVVAADGTWSVTATTVAAGSYTALVRVRDSAGNAASATQAVTVQ